MCLAHRASRIDDCVRAWPAMGFVADIVRRLLLISSDLPASADCQLRRDEAVARP